MALALAACGPAVLVDQDVSFLVPLSQARTFLPVSGASGGRPLLIGLGLKSAGVGAQTTAYSVWLRAIPLEFFSLALIAITFVSMFRSGRPGDAAAKPDAPAAKMDMAMDSKQPLITPRLMNLIVPMLSVIGLSIFYYLLFGFQRSKDASLLGAIANTEPNRAMLVALFIAIFVTSIFYAFQKYGFKDMIPDFISGGNEIVPTLAILGIAWPLASVAQKLGLNVFIQQLVGNALPVWSVAVTVFILSATVTYFIGSGWGAASLIMPFAIPLAVTVGASIPLCAAAVITGGTFGDVTSPVAGMTNMASNVAHADHARYLRYAAPYNFSAAGVAAALYLIVGLVW